MSKSLRNVVSTMAWNGRVLIYGFEQFDSIWAEEHNLPWYDCTILNKGVNIKPYLHDLKIKLNNAHLPDYNVFSRYSVPIVSSYMKDVLIKAGVKNVEWYCMPIEHMKKSLYEYEEYWLMNILSVIDATDWEKSTYDQEVKVVYGPRKGKPVLDDIYLDENKINDEPIFRNKTLSRCIYIRDDVATAIMAAECTGAAICEPHQARWPMISDFEGIHHAYKNGLNDLETQLEGYTKERGQERAAAEKARYKRLYKLRHKKIKKSPKGEG